MPETGGGEDDRSEPARVPLSRARVLEAALAMIDESGASALSMRKLGQALGRDPMSLYRYARSRADLLDGVLDLIIGQIPVPRGPGSWEEELRALARSARRVILAHPNVMPVLVTRFLSTSLVDRPSAALERLEGVLGVLAGAGFTGGELVRAARAYRGLVYGHVLDELQAVAADPAGQGRLEEDLQRLSAAEFPHLRALAGDLAAYDGAAQLETGLDVLFADLRARLAACQPHPLTALDRPGPPRRPAVGTEHHR